MTRWLVALLIAVFAVTSTGEAAAQLRYAGDIEALWYLRTDLFDTLVPLRGQAVAQKVLDHITPFFQGQLPRALRPAQAAPHTPS